MAANMLDKIAEFTEWALVATVTVGMIAIVARFYTEFYPW